MTNLEEEHTALHIAVMNRVIDRARRQALFPCGNFHLSHGWPMLPETSTTVSLPVAEAPALSFAQPAASQCRAILAHRSAPQVGGSSLFSPASASPLCLIAPGPSPPLSSFPAFPASFRPRSAAPLPPVLPTPGPAGWLGPTGSLRSPVLSTSPDGSRSLAVWSHHHLPGASPGSLPTRRAVTRAFRLGTPRWLRRFAPAFSTASCRLSSLRAGTLPAATKTPASAPQSVRTGRARPARLPASAACLAQLVHHTELWHTVLT